MARRCPLGSPRYLSFATFPDGIPVASARARLPMTEAQDPRHPPIQRACDPGNEEAWVEFCLGSSPIGGKNCKRTPA
jgi:hypothetical protein